MIPKQLEAFHKAMEPYRRISELANKFSHLNQFAHPASQFQFKIHEVIAPLTQKLLALNVPDHISSVLKQLEAFQGVGGRLKELLEKTPDHLLQLSAYGWYAEVLDNGFSYFEYLGELIEEGKIDELNEHLTKHYTENLSTIITILCERHPDRSHFFREIETGHTNKLYSLSIPSTLAQVDGISHDFFKKKFFIKNRNTYLPEISTELLNASESVLELVISPITNNTPIIAREMDLADFPVQLNRHAILHGSDKYYGTEINSLKCISLLKYLSDVLDLMGTEKLLE